MTAAPVEGPSYTVGQHGGTYSITAAPWPWWHWRGMLARLRSPTYVMDFWAARDRAVRRTDEDLTWQVLEDTATAWARKRERQLRRAMLLEATIEGWGP